MAYLVEITARAARDLDHLYAQIHVAESMAAARWFNGLEKAVQTLENLPLRCPVAPEGKRAGRALRHLLYGKRPRVYRVLYEIAEPEKTVRVLTIRHWAEDVARSEAID